MCCAALEWLLLPRFVFATRTFEGRATRRFALGAAEEKRLRQRLIAWSPWPWCPLSAELQAMAIESSFVCRLECALCCPGFHEQTREQARKARQSRPLRRESTSDEGLLVRANWRPYPPHECCRILGRHKCLLPSDGFRECCRAPLLRALHS